MPALRIKNKARINVMASVFAESRRVRISSRSKTIDPGGMPGFARVYVTRFKTPPWLIKPYFVSKAPECVLPKSDSSYGSPENDPEYQ